MDPKDDLITVQREILAHVQYHTQALQAIRTSVGWITAIVVISAILSVIRFLLF